MRVRFASPVLSVANVLKHCGPPEAAGTAPFYIIMDKVLGCLNVRNTVEDTLKKKPFLKPYDTVNEIIVLT